MNVNTTDLTWNQLINSTNFTLRVELILFLIIAIITIGSMIFIISQVIDKLPLNNQISALLMYIIIIFILLITLSFITIILNFLLTIVGSIISSILVGIALICYVLDVNKNII